MTSSTSSSATPATSSTVSEPRRARSRSWSGRPHRVAHRMPPGEPVASPGPQGCAWDAVNETIVADAEANRAYPNVPTGRRGTPGAMPSSAGDN